MTTYWMIAAGTVAAAFCLFAVLLRRKGTEAVTAAAALPLCAGLGLLLAKALYEVLMRPEYFLQWGEWNVFLDCRPRRMCFTAGAAGVCLGVWLAARMRGRKPAEVLDCFAAPGALLTAGLRWAEKELGMLGTGAYIGSTGFWSRMPFAVTDAYGDSYAAVFFWEAAAALAMCVYALISRETRPGLRFQKTVFGLCLSQILLENLRNQGMKWGFVHTEQVLCAAVLLLLTALVSRRAAARKERVLPVIVFLLSTAAFVGAELARQKGGSAFLSRYGYGLLAAALAAMTINYALALRRLREDQSSSSTGDSGKESAKGTYPSGERNMA